LFNFTGGAKCAGVDFAPIPFELLPGKTERLKDAKGRLIWTVTARPISDVEQTNREGEIRFYEDQILVLMKEKPGFCAPALHVQHGSGRMLFSPPDARLHEPRHVARLVMVQKFLH
jgi:hypothetical protein